MDLDLLEDLSLTTHTAILTLERLGVDPDQAQIDIMEAIVLMVIDPKRVNSKTIERCVGKDKLAGLFLYLKNKELRRIFHECIC